MVSLQIRHLVGPGDLASTDYAFAEQGMHSIAWLGVALVLFRLDGDGVRSFVVRWGWRVLGALAAVQVLVLQLVVDNPVDRKSVVSGKSVSVRVDLGGRRIIQKTNKRTLSI